MKRFYVFAVFLIFITSISYAKDYEVKKKAGEYNVEVKIDKNPPVVGENNMEIEIKDAAGKPIKDAKVSVNYSMPAMIGMPPMNYKTDAEPKGEKYIAKINLSMSGSWNIAVKIARTGKTSTMKFSVDAH
ncbi:MAG: FixH family protein [Nitrospirota bacterium]